MSVTEYFRSVYEITVEARCAGAVLDFLMRCDIPFYGVRSTEDTVSFRMYPPYFREYAARRRERRFAGETRRRLGFAALCHRYRARVGLIIGALLGVFLLVFSSFFVWDVTVTGNEKLSEREILAALEKEGLYLGAFIPSLDTELIEQKIALTVDGVSFISINLNGTVARTELRERIADTEIVDRQTPSNLIACADGQIESVEITGGVAKVRAGQIVKKGDLLASGVIESEALGGFRTVRARGNVTARTTVSHTVTVALERTEKFYTGVTHTVSKIKFFSKSIKLFGKDGIWDDTCDRIEEERRIYLFGIIKLPLFISHITYAEYEMRPVVLSEQQALDEAKQAMLALRESSLADADILSIHTSHTCDATALTLTRQVECIIDIAEEAPITVPTA